MLSNPMFLLNLMFWPLFYVACLAISLLFIKQQTPRMMLAGGWVLMLMGSLVGQGSTLLAIQGMLPFGFDHPLFSTIRLGVTAMNLAAYACILWALLSIRPKTTLSGG